jgi:preprotein translocase subunit SecG
MQSGESSGLGAIAGGAETFLGKNKAKSFEGKLALATKVSACVFILMSLIVAAIS